QQISERIGCNSAFRGDAQPAQVETASSELFQRADDAGMFDATGDDSTRWVAGKTEQGEVVGFRRAGGEDNLIGASADQRSDLLARVFEGAPRVATGGVRAGRVPSRVSQPRPHRLQRQRTQRRRGVVIEVNSASRDSHFIIIILLTARLPSFYHRSDQLSAQFLPVFPLPERTYVIFFEVVPPWFRIAEAGGRSWRSRSSNFSS